MKVKEVTTVCLDENDMDAVFGTINILKEIICILDKRIPTNKDCSFNYTSSELELCTDLLFDLATTEIRIENISEED